MAMRNTLSDRDRFVSSYRSVNDTVVFDCVMSDDVTIRNTKQTLTYKTAPSTVRGNKRSDAELRRSFR
jgi:hypothetical protein